MYYQSNGTIPDHLSFPTRRSSDLVPAGSDKLAPPAVGLDGRAYRPAQPVARLAAGVGDLHSRRCCPSRSEEHTSELQSRPHLVCRLLLEKKKSSISTTTRLFDTLT